MKLGKRIEIDEASIETIKTLAMVGEDDMLYLINRSEDMDIDEQALCDYISKLEGVDSINDLAIGWRSQLSNVQIVKAFPGLKYLQIYGEKIKSLEGLKWFNGEYICIDTGKNRKRNIDDIAQTPVQRAVIRYAQPADFVSIGKSLSLRELTIHGNPAPDFAEWKNVPLTYLKMQGKFEELRDIGHLKSLDNLYIVASRKFERFAGENPTPRIVTVFSCRQFDTRSLAALQGVEYATINSCAREITIDDIPEHPTIRMLRMLSCKVLADANDIKKKMPKLEKVITDKVRKEFT